MKKFTTILVIVNLFALSFYFVNAYVKHRSEQQEEREAVVKTGRAWERDGLMSQTDHSTLDRLRRTVKKQGLSDKDFAWVKKISDAALRSQNPHADLVRASMASLIGDGPHPTLAQKEWGFHYAVALLQMKDKSPELDKVCGATLIRDLKDKRGVPYLLPLAQHPDKQLREHVQNVLASLGYASTAAK